MLNIASRPASASLPRPKLRSRLKLSFRIPEALFSTFHLARAHLARSSTVSRPTSRSVANALRYYLPPDGEATVISNQLTFRASSPSLIGTPLIHRWKQ